MGRHNKPGGTPLDRFVAGREPALLAAAIGTGLKLAGAFWAELGTPQQAVLNAVVAAVLGTLVAFSTRDGLSAALLGLTQALIALAIGFGLHVEPDMQALIMSFVGTIIAMFVRTQVTAPIPPESAGV